MRVLILLALAATLVACDLPNRPALDETGLLPEVPAIGDMGGGN